MKKKTYTTPSATSVYLQSEATMLATSTGTENFSINPHLSDDAWGTPQSLGTYGDVSDSHGGTIYFDDWN